MDHINSVRAALKAASVKGTPPPVLAIPIPGRAKEIQHAHGITFSQALEEAKTSPMHQLAEALDNHTLTAKPAVNDKLIARFRTWADALETQIEHLGRPLTQNPTPKRNREYQSRLHDCRNVERLQKALRVLAELHQLDRLPDSFAELKTKDEIGRMVRKSTTGGGGYYSVIEADDYADTSDAARLLQTMINGSLAERTERDRLRKIGTLEAEIKLTTIPGFFPTPAAVVEIMLRCARIERGMRICEPEAGSGNIADAITRQYSNIDLEVVEINYSLRELLTLKGYNLIADDFLQISRAEVGEFDRIIMNPPFENLSDVSHVRHAYEMLAPNGILVSVMAPSFEYRNDRKSTEFRAWLDSVNATWENLPDGSFKSSGTGVSTRLLVIEK